MDIKCPQCDGPVRHTLIVDDNHVPKVFCKPCEATYPLKDFALKDQKEWEAERGAIRNRAYAGAWRKGWIAGALDEPENPPYDTGTVTVNKGRECVTWGRAFARYWCEGWDMGKVAGKGVKSACPEPQGAPGATRRKNEG
jgi:hypothetical protein